MHGFCRAGLGNPEESISLWALHCEFSAPWYSIQFSRSVVSDSLQPHESQHARPPCLSPTPGVYSNSCPLSRWCHPAISSSVVPFSSCPQSLPASGSFPMSWLCMRWPKYWSFSLSISPSNEHPGLMSFRMDWLDLLVVQGTLKSLLQHHSSKASILWFSAFFTVQLSHPYMTTGKTIALTRQIFVDKVMSLLFNMLSRFVITFLPRNKCLLISWLQSPSAVILEPPKIKSDTGGLDGEKSACSVGNLGLIPGSGWSPGEGKDNPLWYSCLENPMDRTAWQAAVHVVAKSWTWLND